MPLQQPVNADTPNATFGRQVDSTMGRLTHLLFLRVAVLILPLLQQPIKADIPNAALAQQAATTRGVLMRLLLLRAAAQPLPT